MTLTQSLLEEMERKHAEVVAERDAAVHALHVVAEERDDLLKRLDVCKLGGEDAAAEFNRRGEEVERLKAELSECVKARDLNKSLGDGFSVAMMTAEQRLTELREAAEEVKDARENDVRFIHLRAVLAKVTPRS